MTGKAREHEIRIMGFGLAALALLAAVAALWAVSAFGEPFHLPTHRRPGGDAGLER